MCCVDQVALELESSASQVLRAQECATMPRPQDSLEIGGKKGREGRWAELTKSFLLRILVIDPY